MLTAIVNALAAAAERAMREDAGDGALRFLADEESAARFLEEYSITGSDIFSGNVAPLHKWLQAVYLTDGGTIPVGSYHLAKILDVPRATAAAILQVLASARTS